MNSEKGLGKTLNKYELAEDAAFLCSVRFHKMRADAKAKCILEKRTSNQLLCQYSIEALNFHAFFKKNF